MATLNTLRTKYGIVLSIVIAVVLLAFILGDQLNNRQGPQQYEDFAVAQIAGKTIYSAEYAKAKQPADERKNLSADQAADLAWRTIVFDNYISPACAQAGIVVTQAEMDRVANMYGVQWGQQFEAAGFPQEQIASLIDNTWYVEQQTIAQQMLGEKFGALYALGAYTNKLEVADNIRNMGAAFSGKYVEVPYSVIADADVEVSEQDLAACYEAGKQKNPSLGNRTIRYMLFEIAPTEDDLASVEAEVKQAAEQLSSADMAQAKSVARSFAGEVSPYITFDRIPAAQAETLKSGAMYGPEKLDNAWVMSRIVAKADVPSTFRLEYAVFDDKQQADKIAAMSLDAFDGRVDAFGDEVNRVRNHKGQIETAATIREYLKGSEIAAHPKKHVQDPYSFRCIPQVHGAAKDTIAYVKGKIEDEINSPTDNPTIFPDQDIIVSAGNFHGEPIALPMDFLAIALAELANISERRIYKLISGVRQLPSFLVAKPGVNSGFMIPQYAAAST